MIPRTLAQGITFYLIPSVILSREAAKNPVKRSTQRYRPGSFAYAKDDMKERNFMDILYTDKDIVLCLKPAGVLSTDEPGGLPELLRAELGAKDIRTVHRLDRVVSGLMVLARNAASASELSRQIREGGFDKDYLAVIHGETLPRGEMVDLLARDKAERKTYVADAPGKGVQQAILRYETLGRAEGLSLVKIRLITGRTHQIRAQFAAAGHPLLGDGKYGRERDNKRLGRTGGQALYSYKLSFPFTTDAGCLNGLKGRTWTIRNVDFVEEYFPGVTVD